MTGALALFSLLALLIFVAAVCTLLVFLLIKLFVCIASRYGSRREYESLEDAFSTADVHGMQRTSGYTPSEEFRDKVVL